MLSQCDWVGATHDELVGLTGFPIPIVSNEQVQEIS